MYHSHRCGLAACIHGNQDFAHRVVGKPGNLLAQDVVGPDMKIVHDQRHLLRKSADRGNPASPADETQARPIGYASGVLNSLVTDYRHGQNGDDPTCPATGQQSSRIARTAIGLERG